MKFIDKKISESYFQIYIILSSKEKNQLVKNAKKEILYTKKEQLQEQINIYKNINKTSNSDSSKEKLNILKEELSNLNINSNKYDYKEIQELMCDELLPEIFDHMDENHLIQVFDKELSIIGSLDDNNPLTMIYSFCYIRDDYEIIYPTTKGNEYFFTEKDIDMLQTELLIMNKLYEKESAEKVTEFSDIVFSYFNESDTRLNLLMDINEIESTLSINRTELIGLNKDKHTVYNNNGRSVIIEILEIYNKKVCEINDEIVKKINYENTRTVIDLRKKIKKIFSFIYNMKSNVTSILDKTLDLNNFPIDDYIYKHYFKHIKRKYKNVLNMYQLLDIKLAFFTSYVFYNYQVDLQYYVYYIEKEYDLLYKAKNPNSTLSLEDFLRMRVPHYVLYDFFKSKNLVTERSIDE